MKWGNEHIGGKETGPIRWSLGGDEEAAAQLKGQARILLGEFKKLIQQTTHNSTDKQYSHKYERKDGAVIIVSTTLGSDGYHDTDVVVIYVPIKKKSNAMYRKCIGYIVQCFSYSSIGQREYKINVTTPTGKVLSYYNGIWTNPGWAYLPELSNWSGYPDFNAKYFPLGYYDAETDSIIDNDYAQVFIADRHVTIEYTLTYQATYIPGNWPDISMPTTNPGYSVGTSGGYEYWSPSYHIDASHVSYFVDYPACENTDYGSGPPHTRWYDSRDPDDYLPSVTLNTYTVPGLYYESEWDNIYPWDGTGLTEPEWQTQFDRYLLGTYLITPTIESYNASYALIWQSWIDTKFFNKDFDNVYLQGVQAAHSTAEIGAFYRRNDGHGFSVQCGFRYVNGKLELDKKGQGAGDSCLFMIPMSGDALKFTVKDNLVTDSNFKELADTFITGPGGVAAVTDASGPPGIRPLILDIRSGGGIESPNSWIDTDPDSGQVFEYDYNEYYAAGLFGVPINVEHGLHIVTVDAIANHTGKITVWLLIEDELGVRFEKVSKDTAYIAGDNNDTTIKIKVDDFVEINDIVNFS